MSGGVTDGGSPRRGSGDRGSLHGDPATSVAADGGIDPDPASTAATDVLVTAATGTVGSRVVRELLDRGARVRAATRRPESASVPAGATPTAFDFGRPETWGAALDGADGLFLVHPPGGVGPDRVGEFAAAAARTGVRRVAFLSTLGAERLPFLPHRRIERRLSGLPLTATFLRASFFMQNLTEVHGREIREEGVIRVPAGDGRTSFVDAVDVAAVGALALAGDEPLPGGRDVTGSEALTYDEVAAVLSAALDRRIEYPEPSIPAFLRRSVPERGVGFSLAMVGVYTTARLGLAGRVTDDVSRLLGREPRTLREFAAAHADELR